MRTCQTCRFMAAPRDVYEERETHSRCVRIIHGNGDRETWDGKILPSDSIDLEPAFVTDGSGYSASLKVLPTFGCVLHEPKEVG